MRRFIKNNQFPPKDAVAQLGMLLRKSEFKGHSIFEGILTLAASAKGNDPYGYRGEFIKLVETCQLLQETRRAVEVPKVTKVTKVPKVR